MFDCANGKCIPNHFKCDFEDDCGNMCDEYNFECVYLTCWFYPYRKCRGEDWTRCFPLKGLCDSPTVAGYLTNTASVKTTYVQFCYSTQLH